MAASFELFIDAESHFRFRLRAPDGTVVAVSTAFNDKSTAVAGIAEVRECAGMGLITDLCAGGSAHSSVREPAPSGPALAEVHERHKRSEKFHSRARTIRRIATATRWSGAA